MSIRSSRARSCGYSNDTDIQWGEEWRRKDRERLRRDDLLYPGSHTTILHTRRVLNELFQFVARASGLGVIELVCPILYVMVDDLKEDSKDAAKAQIARMQYVDWTTLRL